MWSLTASSLSLRNILLSLNFTWIYFNLDMKSRVSIINEYYCSTLSKKECTFSSALALRPWYMNYVDIFVWFLISLHSLISSVFPLFLNFLYIVNFMHCCKNSIRLLKISFFICTCKLFHIFLSTCLPLIRWINFSAFCRCRFIASASFTFMLL